MLRRSPYNTRRSALVAAVRLRAPPSPSNMDPALWSVRAVVVVYSGTNKADAFADVDGVSFGDLLDYAQSGDVRRLPDALVGVVSDRMLRFGVQLRDGALRDRIVALDADWVAPSAQSYAATASRVNLSPAEVAAAKQQFGSDVLRHTFSSPTAWARTEDCDLRRRKYIAGAANLPAIHELTPWHISVHGAAAVAQEALRTRAGPKHVRLLRCHLDGRRIVVSPFDKEVATDESPDSLRSIAVAAAATATAAAAAVDGPVDEAVGAAAASAATAATAAAAGTSIDADGTSRSSGADGPANGSDAAGAARPAKRDFKSELNTMCSRRFGAAPVYQTGATEASEADEPLRVTVVMLPDAARTSVRGEAVLSTSKRAKKRAEQSAAFAALRLLEQGSPRKRKMSTAVHDKKVDVDNVVLELKRNVKRQLLSVKEQLESVERNADLAVARATDAVKALAGAAHQDAEKAAQRAKDAALRDQEAALREKDTALAQSAAALRNERSSSQEAHQRAQRAEQQLQELQARLLHTEHVLRNERQHMLHIRRAVAAPGNSN